MSFTLPFYLSCSPPLFLQRDWPLLICILHCSLFLDTTQNTFWLAQKKILTCLTVYFTLHNKELWEILASQSFMYVSYKPLLREFTCVFYYFRPLTGGALAILILWALFKRTYFLNLYILYSKLSIYSINISLCSRHRRKKKVTFTFSLCWWYH